MKKNSLLILLGWITLSSLCQAQTNAQNPLSAKAFNRYILNTYGFTLLGSQTPATGVKVETAKPKITLSGVLHVSASKKNIVSMELSGGVLGNTMQLFSQNKTSGQFSASLTFNRHVGKSVAGHIPGNLTPQEHRMNQAERSLIYQETEQLVYKSAMQLALLDTAFLAKGTLSTLRCVYSKIKRAPDVCFDQFNYEETIRSLLKEYTVVHQNLDTALKHFQQRVNNLHPKKTDTNYLRQKELILLKKNLAQARQHLATAIDTRSDREIAAFKHLYTYTGIRWLSFSPVVSNTSFEEYIKPMAPDIKGSLTKKNHVEWRGKFAFHYLRKKAAPNQFLYVTGAIVPSFIGSLSEKKSFNYTSDTYYSLGVDSLTSPQTGTAYIGRSARRWGYELLGEIYYSFAKQRFVPGIYGKVGYVHNKTFVNADQIPVELGMVFNLPSTVKDAVNLLSFIPFAAWSNLNESKDPQDPTKSVALHDKFMVGLKVGIPINIGK